MKHYTYKTRGVCAAQIDYDIDPDGHIHNVRFLGGCPGNTAAVAKLVEGMPAAEAIKRLSGIQCRGGTSCADQFARALKQQ
jgi:uncharacterized protein (TIGR03905 family)